MKIIIKWFIFGILLLLIENIALSILPYSPFKLVLSFVGGFLIGFVCLLCIINESLK